MSTSGRLGKIGEVQKSVLLDYLNSNEQLRSGKFTPTFPHKRAQECWQEVSRILNAIPEGARKDWRQWRKTWQDMRTKTKSKHAAIRKQKNGTGGGYPMFLTSTERKILGMIGPASLESRRDIQDRDIKDRDIQDRDSQDRDIQDRDIKDQDIQDPDIQDRDIHESVMVFVSP